MKVLPHAGFSTEDVPSSHPIRVCMHVLEMARTDNRVMREAMALAQAGFAVSIIDVEADPTVPLEEEIQGIPVRHISMPSWYAPTRFKPWFLIKLTQLFLRSVFRLIQVKADMYHAHDETALLPCFIAARLYRKPLIFDAHELPLSEPSVTRWRKLTSLSRHLLIGMVSRCASVITVSSPIAEELYKRYYAKKVILVRNVPPYRVVPKSDTLRQYLGLSSDIQIALYQGNIQSDRGLYKLVNAAGFLNQNIIIVIMGKGPSAITSQLKSLITKTGMADRVKLIPPAPYEELLNWTASADIGLITYTMDHSLNIRWCLPNKLFEYLMAGLPILSSQLDAVTEVIKTYHVGQIVTSLESVNIATTINAMLANRFELNQMRSNCLQAAQKLCWEEERQHLICLYQSFLLKEGEK
jgi:glycosyltransferase involved in cell wall biosynthesis